MKSIGLLLRQERHRKRLSRGNLAKSTKIKVGFIEAIEKESWSTLPDFPVVFGFVRSLAKYLDLNEKLILGVLKRDYPPKKLTVSPKPEVGRKFVWGPRASFLTLVSFVFLMVLGYLGFQYVKFTSPPRLEVQSPVEDQTVFAGTLSVVGITDPEAVVKINNQPVLVDETGSFKAEIEVIVETEEIEVKAVSRSGKETIIRRKIVVELKN